MQFSNSVNKLGLVEDIDFLCKTDANSYPLLQKVRNINNAYYDVQRMIWESVVSWQYDDTNNSDLPRLRTTLVHGTQSYELPSVAQRIHRVEVMDNSGNWVKLQPIDVIKDLDIASPEWLENNGLPIYYDLEGDMITLYPTPHSGYVSASSGLCLYVDRNVTLFTSASTTASPGFAPQFHRLLSVAAALDFEGDPNQKKWLLTLKDNLERGLRKFYASRFGEMKPEIRPKGKRKWREYL
jgi:hypothetical protein